MGKIFIQKIKKKSFVLEKLEINNINFIFLKYFESNFFFLNKKNLIQNILFSTFNYNYNICTKNSILNFYVFYLKKETTYFFF